MTRKLPAEKRKKGVGISLDPAVIDRIDAVTPSDVPRSEVVVAWIMAGLIKAEQNISGGNPAYRMLGGDQ